MIEDLPNIPRVYTSLAEWFACLCIIIPLLKGKWHVKHIVYLSLAGVVQYFLQMLAGQFALQFWVLGMGINVAWMFVVLYLLTQYSWRKVVFITSKALIIAEFSAAISWQLYCQFFYNQVDDIFNNSFPYIVTGLILIHLLFLLVEFKMSKHSSDIKIRTKEMMVAFLTALLVFTISNIGFWLEENVVYFGNFVGIFSIRSFVNLSGICILYLQETQRTEDYLKRELFAINYAFQSQYQQYIAYKENSDIINRKCHDLKHQIDIIRSEKNEDKRDQYLVEMESAINNFDSLVETGNPILDTILTRKNLYCIEKQIRLSCLVDGNLLSFMKTMDICSLFGNALDNAIESVEKLDDRDERIVQLKVQEINNFILIRLENYTADTVHFIDGLPETTKKDKMQHGYGVKSISHIVNQYEGTMTMNYEKQWFTLKVLLPRQ